MILLRHKSIIDSLWIPWTTKIHHMGHLVVHLNLIIVALFLILKWQTF